MSAALGDAGAKFVFEHRGRDYEVGYLTQKVKAAFGQRLVSVVLATLPALRGAIPADEYEREKAALLREAGAGHFSFYGDAGREVLRSPDGVLALASLLFDCPRAETDRIVAERAEEVQNLLHLVVAESQPKASSGGGEGSDRPGGHDIDGMIASLVAHPMRMRFEDVANLTDRQIVDLIWHPRDEKGHLDFGGGRFDAGEHETDDQRRARIRAMAKESGLEVKEG